MQSIVISKVVVNRRKLKLSALFFCLLFFNCCAFTQTVSLSFKDDPIEKTFRSIEAQTEFRFIYSTETIKNAKPVTVQLKNAAMPDALSRIFSGQPLSYSMVDRQIIVKANEVKQSPDRMEVRGRVIDETGNPLQGVNVLVKESAAASVTNEEGGFYFTDLRGNEVLIFSMVGYQRMEIPVEGRRRIQVLMPIAVSLLDETIIKGYYTTTRRLNTGSVDKLSGDEINRQPVSNILGALEGRIPGLLLTQKSGLPGAGFSVQIRGQNSIQNGNSPLYIIDGVPFLNDADLLTQRSGINANSPFSTINPADIESIEVLKDADATAIYGSRGANGVILINTRKAKGNATTADVNYYTSWAKVGHTSDYMNTGQYLLMRHEAFANDGVTPNASNAYDFLVWDSSRYTNLQKLLIGGTARTNNLNARISGGNETTHFSLGANYYAETTVFPGDAKDERSSVNFNLNHALPNKRFSLNFSAGYSSDKSNLLTEDLTQFINLPPTLPALYDSSGKLNWNKGGFSFNNPLAITLRKYNVNTDRLTANTVFNFLLSSHINLKTNLGYNDITAEENSLIPISSQDPLQSPTGSSFFGNSSFKNWIIEPQAEFHTALLKKGKLEVLMGTSWQDSYTSRSSINGTGYVNDQMLGATAGAQTLTSKKSFVQYRYNSVFGRLNYNYDNKYLVNLTGRRDGSSRFGPGRQFANFGAAGLAWIFTKEKWIEKNLPFINFGKFRTSYGITGNDLIGNYQFLDTYTATNFPYQGGTSLLPGKLYNPDYSWEQIRKIDLAIELSFFKDRLSLTVDHFRNRSENQIIGYSLPAQTGFSSILKNFPGIVTNTGFEYSLSTKNIEKKWFSWRSNFQFTITKNELKEFPGLQNSGYSKRYIIGKPLNIGIGYQFAGVNPQTGVYQFLDKDKTVTQAPTVADYTYIGTTDPDFYGSIQNSFHYGQWDLDFLFEFRKQQGADPILGHVDMPGSMLNEPVALLQRWQKPGDVAPYQKFTQTFGPAGTAVFNLINSSAYYTEASFIRLKNVSMSYSLPDKVMRKIKMKTCRLYVEGQNLLLLTKYAGPDPETQSLFNLPPLRVIATGIQMTF
jgi:TonB-dependent starch-binding outer membrane protein SusC